jgi:hypothetical protein
LDAKRKALSKPCFNQGDFRRPPFILARANIFWAAIGPRKTEDAAFRTVALANSRQISEPAQGKSFERAFSQENRE